MRPIPRDALARAPIYGPPLWRHTSRLRVRRRNARISALLASLVGLIVFIPGPGWWDLERAVNAIAAPLLIIASFGVCELIERLIFGAARLITRSTRPAHMRVSGEAATGSLTIIDDPTLGALEQLEPTRAALTLIESPRKP